jgi:hypothetical protein
MTIGHRTFAYNHILRRDATIATILITSRLDGDAVVTRVEYAILNQYTVAAFRVAAITIGAIIIYGDTTNDKIFAKQRMEYPEG